MDFKSINKNNEINSTNSPENKRSIDKNTPDSDFSNQHQMSKYSIENQTSKFSNQNQLSKCSNNNQFSDNFKNCNDSENQHKKTNENLHKSDQTYFDFSESEVWKELDNEKKDNKDVKKNDKAEIFYDDFSRDIDSLCSSVSKR